MLASVAIAALLQQQQPAAPGPSPAVRAVVTPASPVITVGDTLRLRGGAVDTLGRPIAGARVRFFGGSFEGSVDTTGVVVGGSPGVVRVFALASLPGAPPGRPTEVTVRVRPAPATRLTVTPDVSRLVVGQRVALDGQVYAANGDRRADPIAWTTSDPRVVSVGPDGRLTARAPGRATLTGRAGRATQTVAVAVDAATARSVEVTGGAASARTGDVLRFRATVRDAAGRAIPTSTVTWSLAPGEGLLGSDGAFVAYTAGTYVVTASVGAASGEAVVRVRPRDVRRAATIVGRAPLPKQLTAEFWPHPDGKHAYLSTIGDRLYALDISNPAAPRITDSVVVDARTMNDVMTTPDGKYGVITREGASTRRNGIVVLSFEDPAHPKPIAEFTETVTGGVHSTFIYRQPRYGTHVYLTDDATGSMRVIDLNDPTRPKEVARWQTPRDAGRVLHDIDVRDGLAYLSYWNDGLVVLDVGKGIKGGSPTNPQLVSQFKYDLDSLYRDVEAEGGAGFIRGTHTAWRHGNYAFVGDEVFSAKPQGIQMGAMGLGKANGRVHVIDLSDIARPREVAWYEPKDGGAHNVWVAGDTLYLGDYQGGLRVVDISGELRGDLLAQGREIAHVHTGDARGTTPNAAMAWGAFHHNGLVWVNDVFSGLWAVRIEPRPAEVVP